MQSCPNFMTTLCVNAKSVRLRLEWVGGVCLGGVIVCLCVDCVAFSETNDEEEAAAAAYLWRQCHTTHASPPAHSSLWPAGSVSTLFFITRWHSAGRLGVDSSS